MVRILIGFFAVCTLGLCRAGTPAEVLRVYAIEPATFDYVFTAVVSASSTNPVLSFNHRGGRTSFVHPGERLGEYVVSDFRPLITKVFNPAIKMHQEQKSGSVTLCGTNGPPITLELGKRLPQPGWMAYLVSLADGNWWMVKESDVVMSGTVPLQIGPVSSNTVTLYQAGGTNTVALITEAESKGLATLWSANVRQAETKAAVEPEPAADPALFDPVPRAAVAQVDLPPPVRRPTRTVVMQYPSRTFFGTDYSCPTEFMVLPAIWSATGQLVRPTMIVPRRFETRSTGFSIETR